MKKATSAERLISIYKPKSFRATTPSSKKYVTKSELVSLLEKYKLKINKSYAVKYKAL